MINKLIDWNAYITIAIKDLNDAGVLYNDLPASIKEQASKLEHKITLYANHNDLPAFISTVRDWKDLMIENFKEKEHIV